MGTRLIVLFGIAGKYFPQVRLAQNQHMVQALAPEGSDKTFGNATLP
jgi:hypothetical protein